MLWEERTLLDSMSDGGAVGGHVMVGSFLVLVEEVVRMPKPPSLSCLLSLSSILVALVTAVSLASSLVLATWSIDDDSSICELVSPVC